MPIFLTILGVTLSGEKANKYFEMSYSHEPLAYYPALLLNIYMNLKFKDVFGFVLLKAEDFAKSLITPGYIMYFLVGFIFLYLVFLISLIRQKNN